MWFSLFHTFVSLRVLIFPLNVGAFSLSHSPSSLTYSAIYFHASLVLFLPIIFHSAFSFALGSPYSFHSQFLFSALHSIFLFTKELFIFSFTGSHCLTAFTQQLREDWGTDNAFRHSLPPSISHFSNQQQELPHIELNYLTSILGNA